MVSPTPLQLASIIPILFLTILARLYYLATHRRPYKGIPYSPSSTSQLWGDIPTLNAEAQRLRDPSKAPLAHFSAHRSPVVQLFLAPLWKPLVFVNDTREVEDLLSNRTCDFDKAHATVDPFRPLVPGASICKVKGAEWRAQVRLWTDVISVGYLRDVAAPVMHDAATELVGLFRAKSEVAGGRPFAVAEDFGIATFDVIWKAMLGADQHGIENERRAVLAAVLEQPASKDEPAVLAAAGKSDEWDAAAYFLWLIPVTAAFPVPWVMHWLYSLTPRWRRHWAVKKRLKDELIGGSRARFADLGDQKDNESIAEKRDICALDRALRRFDKVSPADSYRPTTDDMYDELLLLLMSVSTSPDGSSQTHTTDGITSPQGHETTATLLAWTAKILTTNQTEQARLRDALREHFPSTRQTPSAHAILAANIPYLNASIEELIRVANVFPEVVRAAAIDTELLGHRIPKGATVVCSTYVGHRPFGLDVVPEEVRSDNSRANKGGYGRFWQADVDRYHPERWLREDGSFNAKALPKLAFSLGPRACFGESLTAAS